MTSIPRPLLLVLQEKEKQVQRIRCIFHRQLSVPLANSSATLLAYKYTWKYEQSSGDPGRVQLLYERAITDFPVSSDLWLDYTRYLDKTLKVGNVVRDVYSRATKNCPWVGELWVRSLLSLECGRAYEEEISTYLDVLLARIDGLRRRILFSSEVEGALDYSLIRETFQCASDYLSEQMKNTNGLLRLYAYCGTMLEAWQSYISMEIELGHTGTGSGGWQFKGLGRALPSPGPGPYNVK
ncbi:EMBRYO DEFECTIVE 140 [Citrus sinensis]|uniref:EMBRYO DEFECTIVE 140 n=1 Tax=Citrus sinensis TaxID=2711 RepID=A0ACB8K6E9_CITSI|nr:EMBRYO DEFECTIVE 140 [Citrus sinensis]